MKFHKIYIALLFFVLSSYQIKSQEIIWGENPQNNSNNGYFMTIGENESGVYILSHSSRKQEITSFSIERYSHNLFFKNKKSIKERGHKLSRIQILGDNVFYSLTPTKKKIGDVTVNGFLINEQLENYIKKQPLLTLNTQSRSQSYFFKLKSSPNNDFIGIFGFIDNINKEGKQIVYRLYDAELNLVQQRKFNIEFNFIETDILSYYLDNDGNFYLIIEHANNNIKVGNGRFESILVYCNFNNDKLNLIPITDKGFRIKNCDFISDDSLNTVFASGFFGIESNNYQKGIFQIGIDQQNGDVKFNTFTDIPLSFISDVLGEKLLNKGELLNSFYIRKLVRTNDNTTILVAEKYFSDIFYDQYWMNGTPVSISRKLFNYNEIIVLCLDTLGNICWNKVIQKKQASQDDYGYYSSIMVSVIPDFISIIYNDRMSISKDVLEYRITKDGEISSSILLPSEELYTYIVPVEGKQTGYNRVVIPVLRQRDYSLLKIIFKNN